MAAALAATAATVRPMLTVAKVVAHGVADGAVLSCGLRRGDAPRAHHQRSGASRDGRRNRPPPHHLLIQMTSRTGELLPVLRARAAVLSQEIRDIVIRLDTLRATQQPPALFDANKQVQVMPLAVNSALEDNTSLVHMAKTMLKLAKQEPQADMAEQIAELRAMLRTVALAEASIAERLTALLPAAAAS